MKATEQYFPVVLFIMLCKVVLTFKSMDEILWCDHSNETSLAVLLNGTICFTKFLTVLTGKIMLAVINDHVSVQMIASLGGDVKPLALSPSYFLINWKGT